MSATAARIRHADFLRPATLADPYPLLAELREQERELSTERTGSVWLFRADSIAAALRDPRLSVAAIGQNLNRLAAATLAPGERACFLEAMLLRTDLLFYVDPPRHTRLRHLLQGWFTPAVVAGLQPRAASIVDDLLAAVARRDRFDLIEAIAGRLPALVIAEIVGIPAAGAGAIVAFSNALTATANRGRLDHRWTEGTRDAMAAFTAYLQPLIEQRRRQRLPRPDLLTALVHALDAGECGERELIALCMTVAVGGYETTRGLIANAVLTLLRHPDQWARLRGAPELLPAAIEEVVRFESPIQVTARVALEPVELGGITIRPGTLDECWIGTANCDPARFPDPDRFDIGRTPNRHLGFGLGHHHCLGFTLARLETAAVLAVLLRHDRDLRLAGDEIAWQPSGMFRSPSVLPLVWH